MSSPYPRDDFDAAAPPRDGRRGAHRAAGRGAAGLLAPLVVAAVVAVAGGTAWVALSPGGSSSASAATTGDGAASGAAAAATGGDAASGAAAGGSDAAPSPTQTADQSVPVTVLNGTGTKGLAATTATTLEQGGWTVPTTGNATSAQRSAHHGTTVLYPSADLEATATALATALGGSAALDDTAPAGTLTVLLLP